MEVGHLYVVGEREWGDETGQDEMVLDGLASFWIGDALRLRCVYIAQVPGRLEAIMDASFVQTLRGDCHFRSICTCRWMDYDLVSYVSHVLNSVKV